MAKRRKDGDWSLVQRPNADGNGGYRWQWWEGEKPNRTKKSSTTFKTEGEAFAWRDAVINDPTRLGLAPESFAAAAQRWLKTLKARPENKRDYERLLTGHLLPAFGEMKLSEITADELNEYLEIKRDGLGEAQPGFKKQLSVTTLRRHMWIVRGIYAHAIQTGKHHAANPGLGALAVSAGARTSKTPPSLREENQHKLEAEIPDLWKPLYTVLLGTGLRWGEASGLSWLNWSPEQGTYGFLVVAGAVKKSGKWEPIGKSDYAYRRIPVPQEVKPALELQRTRLIESGDYKPDGLIFPSVRKKSYISNSYINQKVLKPAAKRAGIKDIAAHTLRHTFALNAINDGVNPSRLCKLMGHHSPGFTMARYGMWWGGDIEPLTMPKRK